MKLRIFYLMLLATALIACKEDFLDKKPNSNIVVPKILSELQALLENHTVINVNGGLAQVSSDDYTIPDHAAYQALPNATSRNTYIWAKDLFEEESPIMDWNNLYKVVFYTNNVLKQLELDKDQEGPAKDNLKGWALFIRAYAFYDLVSNFSAVYDPATAESSPGIPLRTDPGIDYTQQRATVAQTYELILSDLKTATTLLVPNVSTTNPNRASRPAAYALLARIYLYMGDYALAETAADSCLKYHIKLINFNSLSTSSITPIGYVSDETIFYAAQVNTYAELTSVSTLIRPYSISPDLLGSYAANDLRSQVYFVKNANGTVNSKRRYTAANTPFTGLATDEIYLIKAECLARRNEAGTAMKTLNDLLITRFSTNKFVALTAASKEEAVNIVLNERRKELVWRGLRWSDLKRLNREGRNIPLSRTLNGITYTLSPNSTLYTFPIPTQEILSGGIEQNVR